VPHGIVESIDQSKIHCYDDWIFQPRRVDHTLETAGVGGKVVVDIKRFIPIAETNEINSYGSRNRGDVGDDLPPKIRVRAMGSTPSEQPASKIMSLLAQPDLDAPVLLSTVLIAIGSDWQILPVSVH